MYKLQSQAARVGTLGFFAFDGFHEIEWQMGDGCAANG